MNNVVITENKINGNLTKYSYEDRWNANPPLDFTGDGRAWHDRAIELTDYVENNLINRDDGFVRYYNCQSEKLCHSLHKVNGEPVPLTRSEIIKHFCSTDNQRMGLYNYSADGLSKWVVLDIDAHDGLLFKNWNVAIDVASTLEEAGITFQIYHTNGDYGFHIWVLFSSAIPFLQAQAIGNYAITDIDEEYHIEVFPKGTKVCPWGNVVRLPGEHHKHKWFTNVFDWQNNKWLSGNDAIDYIITSPANNIDLISEEVKHFKPILLRNPEAFKTGEARSSEFDQYKGKIHTLDILKLVEPILTGSSSNGWHQIVCPNSENHSGDEFAAVYPNENNWSGFNCFHEHCKNHDLAWLLSQFPIDKVDGCCKEKKEVILDATDVEAKMDGIKSLGQHLEESSVESKTETKPVETDPTKASGDDFLNELKAKEARKKAAEEAAAKAEEDAAWEGLYDGFEMLRRAQNTKSEYLFTKLIETGVITLLTGLPYSGKSLIVLHIMVSLLRQMAFCGHECISKPVPVLYINADRLRDEQFHRRLQHVCKDDGVLMGILNMMVFTNCENLPKTLDETYIKAKVRAMKKRYNSDSVLVIIDTLRPALLLEQSAGAENDPGVMSKLLTPIRQVAKDENLAVLLLHHNNRSRDDYSGSAAIAGSTDAIWTISKKDNMAMVKTEHRDCGMINFEIELGPKEDIPKIAVNPYAEFIKEFPSHSEKAWTRKQAYEHFKDLSESTVDNKIKEACKSSIHPRLNEVGSGHKNDPYKYHVV